MTHQCIKECSEIIQFIIITQCTEKTTAPIDDLRVRFHLMRELIRKALTSCDGLSLSSK